MNKKYMLIGAISLIVIILILLLILNISNTTTKLKPETMSEATKMKIIKGENVDVSPETRTKVKKEYLTGCESLTNTEEKIHCLEVYYNVESTMQIKEECSTKNNQEEKEKCMDEYYITQAHTSRNRVFCETIKNEISREECFSYTD